MPKQFNEGIYSFPQMVLEQLFIHMKKMEEERKEKDKEKNKRNLHPYLMQHIKI